MSYFALDYIGFHQIAYAHALTVSDYHFSFSTVGFGTYHARESETSGLIEIGYVVKNPLVIDNHTINETYIAQEGDVFIFPPDHEITVHSQNAGEHRHVTSEYMIDARVEIHHDNDIEKPSADDMSKRFFLPYLIPSDAAGNAVRNKIHKVASDHALLISKGYFRQSADFCSLIDSLRQVSDPSETIKPYISPRYKANCKKAEEYIERNMLRRIQIQEIADAVGISKTYLINIFSKYKGMGLAEYINRVKLNHMLLMISRYGYTMKQACECVGYCDPNYVSRIFPKYYGVSLTEYIKTWKHFPSEK